MLADVSIALSVEHAYQCPCVMTPSGSEARRMIVVAWARRNGFW